MKEKDQHTIHLILFISHEQHCSSRNLKYAEWSHVFTFLDKLLSAVLWKKENIHHYSIKRGSFLEKAWDERKAVYPFSMDSRKRRP